MIPLKRSKANFKRSIARATGVPTTRPGRSRKAKNLKAQGLFCLIVVTLIIHVVSGGDGV